MTDELKCIVEIKALSHSNKMLLLYHYFGMSHDNWRDGTCSSNLTTALLDELLWPIIREDLHELSFVHELCTKPDGKGYTS